MKKILIIEDDTFLGDVLMQKLKQEGYDVSLASDGAVGLKEFADSKPDLVLLDIILPTMNGYEILEARAKDPAIANIPVIIISNSGQPIEINRALSLGVRDYAVKAQMDPEEIAQKVHACLRETTTSPGTRLAGKKILWVEDDSFLSDLLAQKLSHEGCSSMYARDGEQALEMLKKEVPDIVLLDVILPGMSGFDVLKTIKADERLKHIPVMVLSNLGQSADTQKAKELGAIKYLVKAEHDLDDILDEVAQVLMPKP